MTSRLPQGPNVLLGPGDDAAVVAAPDRRVVVTTDVLVEGVHFRRDWSGAYDVGRKAAAQSLADVAAMGATPTAVVVGLAAPGDLPLDWPDGLADGLRDECDRAGASVVGGDVVAAPLVVVSVTALGDLVGERPVVRSGARPGDVVVVAGTLGGAAAGLRALREGRTEAPEAQMHRRPSPPYALGPALARAGATAMVDTSDGLLSDLGHVAEASGVRVEVETRRLAAVAAPGAGPDDVLRGGEDHALAATLPAGALLPRGCAVVGRVVEGGGVLVDGAAPTGARGWEHFR